MWFTSGFWKISLFVFYIKTAYTVDSLRDKEKGSHEGFKRGFKDAEIAKRKVEVVKRAKNYEKRIDVMIDQDFANQRFQRDPVLDFMSRRLRFKRKTKHSDTSISSSSSLEMKNWKDEWKEHWLQKKLEAINSSVPKGDIVNMVAARPWGIPCGDPNQHDAPWGTCMLPVECEAEYRIYRGDYFCGRTKFICCALQMTNYDLYAGFDVSFADSSLATDSEEKKNRMRGSKEKKKRKKNADKKRRLRERKKRKRKIERTIRRIVREIRKILHRTYRNGTSARKKKTKLLKKFIKFMKKQYIKDRKAVKDIHEMELIKIDAALLKRLNSIKGMNQQFVRNATFRAIIENGTISKQNARMLVEAYPELSGLLNMRRHSRVKKPIVNDYLDYDIEYGYLYYT